MRSFWKSLGLVGLLSGAPAIAQDSGYADMSRGEVNKILQNRAVVLNDKNFQREVLDYDGAVIVLFDSTCALTERARNLNTNMERVYLLLMDQFDDKIVNGNDLRFGYYDVCKYVALTGKVLYDQNVRSIETHMYLNGKKIDWMVGAPADESGINPTFRNMSRAWIPWNLFEEQDQDCNVNCTYLFEGQYQLHEVRK